MHFSTCSENFKNKELLEETKKKINKLKIKKEKLLENKKSIEKNMKYFIFKI